MKTAVFRKANNAGQVLNFVSHHAPSAKSAVFRALMDRLDSHIRADDLEEKEVERQRVMETLESNGIRRASSKMLTREEKPRKGKRRRALNK